MIDNRPVLPTVPLTVPPTVPPTVPSLPPATRFRPWPLRLLMAGLGLAWKSGALPAPDLSAATLRRQAEAATGLTADSIDRSFFDAQLRVLLAALRDEARLSDFGRLVAHGTILKVMQERLWHEDLLARHPEIARIELAPPIVIVGQMRSGTTRLHRLLACDPRFDALKLYEAQNPVPSPATLRALRAGRPDPRIRHTRWALRFLARINPGILHTHPTGAEMVDEEVGLLLQSLSGALIEGQWRVPAFARHGEQVSQLPAYRRMKALLQLRCWLGGHDPARPLVLKSPQYLQDLDAVRTIFPGALFLFLHRPAAELVASGASLVWNQMVIQSDHVDPQWIGREWLAKTRHRHQVAQRIRPLIAADRQIDLAFAEMNADWRPAIAHIYARLGCDLPAAVLARMQAWMAQSQSQSQSAGDFRRHAYDLGQFGLSSRDIANASGGDAQVND